LLVLPLQGRKFIGDPPPVAPAVNEISVLRTDLIIRLSAKYSKREIFPVNFSTGSSYEPIYYPAEFFSAIPFEIETVPSLAIF